MTTRSLGGGTHIKNLRTAPSFRPCHCRLHIVLLASSSSGQFAQYGHHLMAQLSALKRHVSCIAPARLIPYSRWLVLLCVIILLVMSSWWHVRDGSNKRLSRSRPRPFLINMFTVLTRIQSDHPPEYSAVILYLVLTRRNEETFKSLSLLFQNAPHLYPWPIVLFHSGDFNDKFAGEDFRSRLLAEIGAGTENSLNFVNRIGFERLDLTLPEGMSSNVAVIKPVFADGWPGTPNMHALNPSANVLSQDISIRAPSSHNLYSPSVGQRHILPSTRYRFLHYRAAVL
jgi:hypothetical protein